MPTPDSLNASAPLAHRLRPKDFAHFKGQHHLTAPGTSLRRLIESDRFQGLLFWGPPGCGKTTLALIIAEASDRPLKCLSAVSATVKDLRQVIQDSHEHLQQGGKAHLLFLDEIHRLSRNQQDVLLPALEEGHIRFIGATTENPSFEVNAAVLSRCLTFTLKPISEAALVEILQRALTHEEVTTKRPSSPTVEEAVLQAIARSASGDARRSLNLLEAVLAGVPEDTTHITTASLEELTASLPLRYDRAGDSHYDTVSAFIKSIRANHPDAALHYLARMIESGEDPVFIARRLVIAASEDIGNANPMALVVATACAEGCAMVGMPEGRILLAQATTYLASSPKSNRSYMALEKALEDVRAFGALEIPLTLRNAPTRFMKEIGYGKGYAYAHDETEKARAMSYLPEKLRGRLYYDPKPVGAEKGLLEILRSNRPTGDDKHA